MEWLSHSQKKHCELCKTPFRFTKLYDPNMPKSLPPYVFVSHVAKYLFRNLLVWLRAALVASIWLGWLPYLMRSVWSFMFWISDEGLGGRSSLFGSLNATLGGGLDALAATTHDANVCPSSPLFAATTTAATIGGLLDSLPPESAKLVRGLYGINLTTNDPIYSTVLRLLFGSVGLSEKPPAMIPNATASVLARTASDPAHQSLLGGVGFLQNLTRHPSVNRIVIATLEGQIITVLVIVCFILIILVRDYVVQQQPEINMRAAFAAVENPPPAPLQAQEAAEVAREANHDFADPLVGPVGRAPDLEPDPPVDLDDVGTDVSAEEEQDFPPLRRQPSESAFSESPASGTQDADSQSIQTVPHPGPSTAGMRESESAVQQYLDILREAGGDPEEILRIARERNLEAKLEYWISLTRTVVARRAATDGEAADVDERAAGPSVGSSQTTMREEAGSDASTLHDSGALDQSLDAGQSPMPQNGADPKGKGRLTEQEEGEEEEEENEEAGDHVAAGLFRPRANTDGPKISNTIHPLANNNWSFTDLPAPAEPSSAAASAEPWFPGLSSPDEPVDRHQHPAPRTSTRVQGPVGPSLGDTDRPPSPVEDNRSHGLQESHRPGPDAAFPPDREDQADGAGATAGPHPEEAAAPAPRREPRGLLDRVADFMWRDVENIAPRELAAVNFLGDFVQPGDGDDDRDNGRAEDGERDEEDAGDAAAAGIDPDGIDDAEDLEGILELLGMRGPIAGLFQNAIFCAFLVSITIFLGIFLPYNIGRVTFWTLANPARPARMLFSLSKFVQDCCLVILGLASSAASEAIHVLGRALMLTRVAEVALGATNASWAMTVSAANRIGGSFMTELPIISASEMRNFSALSHEALLVIKGHVASSLSALWRLCAFLSGGEYGISGSEALAAASSASAIAWESLKELPRLVASPGSWVLNLSLTQATGTVNPELAHWGGVDRFWAILAGYVTLSLMAGLYLRRGAPFSTGQAGQEWEASIVDGLNQASGVMKVILIIGIEMLVFPLYCGMLLDVALLPLFENATLKSRLLFTVNYPVTSLFVHWFIGTGYMFHFALFVSMCRKIMRKGVLYFIRDPDDPDFHPVRDVLERNVTTQLRKILFSAFVYGALVLVCLGGVVWGLSWSLPGVLPIHYSSNEPVLEFPVDLLFYNFLMPLAVRFFRPSDGLHAMYTWWFRRCARALRITWFLFGERRVDEEGQLVLASDSPARKLPVWRRLFLGVNSRGQVVVQTWREVLADGTAKPKPTASRDQMLLLNLRKMGLVRSGQLIPDGRFVRAPASDQVKIPKGRSVFLDVTENNRRLDGMADRPGTDIYSTDQYQFVYVPPHFRVRVFLFILLIWIFAAVTGVSITIIPLAFGRWMLRSLIPQHVRTNDIYAFSIGIYALGTAAYALFRARSIYGDVKARVTSAVWSAYQREAVRRACGGIAQAARIVYAYFFVLVVFPLLIASLTELYALIPLHELMYSVLLTEEGRKAVASGTASEPNPVHTVRVIQAWTIGLLYLKLGLRAVLTCFGDSRVAAAARAVPRRGWLDPDVTVLTRAFIVPGLAIWSAAVVTPLLFAKFTIANGLADAVVQAAGVDLADGGGPPDRAMYDAYVVLIYRLSFPFVALGVATGLTLWSVVGVFRSWQVRIRDEAYLIGERLHNFSAATGGPRPQGGWSAGGARI